ncbi:MAG: hypothetical protein IIA67_13775, partial [Planctomycetes bacterium]|nr:hypothetical protein [Planctomycetota bacterium]
GDAFQFRINIVPGDVTGDERVDRADLIDLIHSLGEQSASAESLRRDLTGDGRVDVDDLRAALLRLGSRLPTAEPSAFGSATPQAAVDVVFERLGGAGAAAERLLRADSFEAFGTSGESVRGRRARVDWRPSVLERLNDTNAGHRTGSATHRASRGSVIDGAPDAESSQSPDRLVSRRRNRV